MPNFKQFADAINKKFLELSTNGTLLKVNISKEQLWETYQNSYTPEHNPIFRERRVHECNTCYSFIKKLGAVVGVVDGQLETIWNVSNLPQPYQTVANTMHSLVTTGAISSVFLTDEKLAGREFNMEESETGSIRWDHFYADIDQAYISQSVAADSGTIESTVSVFKRALDEFSTTSLETVIDLCDTVYRGEEFKSTVQKFLLAKKAYELAPNKAIFLWTEYKNYPAKIRNSAIGSFIIDINEGTDLEEAVSKYEKVVAPSNYKRTTAVVTEGMKQQAKAKIIELGLEPSLPRRHATLDDVSVNDVLFANIDAQSTMKDSLDTLLDNVTTSTPVSPNTAAQEIVIEDLLVLIKEKQPTNIEVLVENKHVSNFVSLVAPINPDAPSMLKWDNNFSWSYNGEVTDSMKERVKAAGGKVDGDLNFRLQWNEDKNDTRNDLDLHCQSPKSHIYYSNPRGRCGGRLDVDITSPGSNIAVENITWANKSTMPDGHYKMFIKNFSGRNRDGFRAQVEFNGQVFEYNYPSSVTSDVHVATVTLKDGEFSIEHHLTPSSASKEVYGTSTLQWQKVSTIMLSPNHWSNQSIGNKHYFFMLDGCKNPDSVRGFYNEFLSEDLRPHRKVFEVLSANMKCPYSDEQLSGLGFSSTQRNELSIKIDNRPYLVQF